MEEAAPQPTVDIYDISGSQPVLGTIAPEEVESAIGSGKFSFPKEAKVSVINPDGQLGDIDANEAPEAFKQGHKYATPDAVDNANYGGVGQTAVAALEGAAQGVAGPLATAIEVGPLGIPAKDVLKRQQVNPWAHGLGETGGFMAGALAGTGEAALVGKLGEGVAGLAGLGSASGIAAKIGAGAIKASAEMMAIQSGDELSKAILQSPGQTIGTAAIDIGLSGLLGGAIGGAFSGVSSLGRASLDKLGGDGFLSDFKNRLGVRASGASLTEGISHDLVNTTEFYHNTGSEIGGAEGLKAQALKNLMPQQVTPEMANSIFDVSSKANEAISEMNKQGVPDRLIKKFQNKLDEFMNVAVYEGSTPAQHFDALNSFKKDLANFSKGNFGPFAVPAHSEAYDFLNITKELGHDIRIGLENPEVWGEPVASLQKDINAAWTKAIPAVKDMENKFFPKISNVREISPERIESYINQNGKITSQTIRQQMVGKFVDSMETFHKAVSNIYEKAGLEAPEIPGMGALKDSLNKPSMGHRLADVWFDRLGSEALGNAAGAAAGAAVIPGFKGAYLGKELLGPAFGTLIQPLVEGAYSFTGFKQANGFAESVLKGTKQLEKSSKSIFDGSSVIPLNIYPDKEKLEKLDGHLKDLSLNQEKMLNVGGNLGNYMPNHAVSLASTAMKSVNLANMLRPANQKANPLDSDIPVSPSKASEWYRSLSVMQQPLVALEHIKDGTLLPKDVQIIKGLYPDLYSKMSQQLNDSMIDHISKGENVPYKLRQGLSMFLGYPLDSTFTQPMILAAQMPFMMKPQPEQPQQQGQGKSKKGTSKLGEMAKSMETPSQSRESHRNKA